MRMSQTPIQGEKCCATIVPHPDKVNPLASIHQILQRPEGSKAYPLYLEIA
jgi:hypothetical protein